MEIMVLEYESVDGDVRKTSEEMDEMRHKTLAYEYLCHLEEAKVWLEACLKESLPVTTELEENLRNGVYLAKLGHFIAPDILPAHKIYDPEQKRFKSYGLQFRHTDNINQWLKVLKTTELPVTFQPETTDVYDKKNMPRVIYCIHALSTHLFKLGKAPLIQDLYGKAMFTNEEIDTMSKELRRYGIQMPAFQKIGGLLSGSVHGNMAVLHAAVINVNQAIDSEEDLETSLLNPAVGLKYVVPEYCNEYWQVLIEAKNSKILATLNKSLNDSYVADVYDEILTQAEIQGHIIAVDLLNTWRKTVNAARREDDEALLDELKAPWLNLKSVDRENGKLYLQKIAELVETRNVRYENILDWSQMLQSIVHDGNAKAKHDHNVKQAVYTVNQALNNNVSLFHEALCKLHAITNNIVIDEYALPMVYEELSMDRIEGESDLSYDEIVGSTRILSLVANVTKAVEIGSATAVWTSLVQRGLPVDSLRVEAAVAYHRILTVAHAAKKQANLPCPILTNSDIQDCIDEVNLQEDNTQDLISILGDVNLTVKNNDRAGLMMALEKKNLNLSGKLKHSDSQIYMRLLKTTMKKNGNRELWLEDIQNVVEEMAQETEEVQAMCASMGQVNLALMRMDSIALTAALNNLNLYNFDMDIGWFNTFLEAFEENSKNTCPWIVYHTKSGKTVYLNVENCTQSWHTPKDFRPFSRYLSLKDVKNIVDRMNKNNEEAKLKKAMESIVKLQAHIRGYLVRYKISQRNEYFTRNINSVVKLQAWWRGITVKHLYRKILQDKKEKRKSSIKPRDPWEFYKSQETRIVRVQALWRGRCARQAFLQLFHRKNPPFKVVKHFVPILDFSTEDYEKEIQLQTLRAEAVQAIRKNQELSKQLDDMDIKIGLLVQNRITLQDVVAHRTKLNDLVNQTNTTLPVDDTNKHQGGDGKSSTMKTILSTTTRGLKSLTKESRRLLDGYQYLFYTLQTNPVYLSKLLFCLPQSRTNQFLQNVILTLYNFGSNTRDEYLLLKLFRSSLEEEINCKFNKPLDVISGNPIVLKMAVNHARQMNGLTSLRNIVGPLVEKVLNDKNLSFDTSPVDIYKVWRNQMEAHTGQISSLPYAVTQEEALSYDEVRSRLTKGLQSLRATVTVFLDRITACQDMLPFSILYMARVLNYTLSKKFPNAPEKDILKVVGHLIYYQFINAAIVAPDAFDIVTLSHDRALSNDQRRNLASVAKILHFSASKKGFGDESAHLQCLNQFIIDCHEKMKSFFRKCCQGPSLEEHFSVDEYSEATLLYKPHIYISVQEICNTHCLLVEYEDIIAPDLGDHLHSLLDGVGPVGPDGDVPLAGLTGPLATAEVCLTLQDKYQLPQDDLSDINKLFIKTKELCVSVLPFLNGDHLLEALCIGTTKEQQEQYKACVQQKLYSGMIKPNENITLKEHIAMLRKYLNKLEDEGYVTREDGYQSIVTAIALDLCNKGKYRRGQLRALQTMKKTKQTLDEKTRFYEDQCDFYNQYINKCLENLNAGRRTVHSLDRKGSKVPGKVKSKMSIKYSASKLHHKGVLIDVVGLTVSQLKSVQFEITPTDHNGIFTVRGKFMGVEVEQIELDVQHLLQLQYDGCTIMDLFGKAQVNVNLLLFLLNRKFYGKT